MEPRDKRLNIFKGSIYFENVLNYPACMCVCVCVSAMSQIRRKPHKCRRDGDDAATIGAEAQSGGQLVRKFVRSKRQRRSKVPAEPRHSLVACIQNVSNVRSSVALCRGKVATLFLFLFDKKKKNGEMDEDRARRFQFIFVRPIVRFGPFQKLVKKKNSVVCVCVCNL